MRYATIFWGWVLLGTVGAAVAQAGSEIRLYHPQPKLLGFSARELLTEEIQEIQPAFLTGVRVDAVSENSAAAAGDVQRGDVIVEYSRLPVLGVKHLQHLVAETPPGRQVVLTLVRSGQSLTRQIEIPQISQSRERPHAADQRWDPPEPGLESRVDRLDSRAFLFLERPRLGILGANLTGQLADFFKVEGQGILVAEVFDDSPARQAELRAGDVIVSVDGQKVATLNQLSQRLVSAEHLLEVVRGGRTQRLTVRLRRQNRLTAF